MALATLSIDLVAQLASLQAGMDKAGRLAEKQAAQIESRYARIADAGRAVGAALAGAISVAGLAAFFKTTVDGLDALNDVKDATGATIENISALEDIAARTGARFEDVASALLRFNKVLSDATPGSETARTLESIGLSAEALAKLDPAEGLRQLAVALEGYADSGAKARIVQELFGKSSQQAAAFLKDLAEQGQLNATVTAQQVEEAEKFNRQLFEFKKTATDAARAIVGELLPVINGLFSAAKQDGGFAKLFGLDGLSAKVDQVSAAYQLLALARERITPLSILEKDPNNQRALDELARIDARAKRLAETFKAARTEMLGIGTSAAGAGRGFINPPLIRPDAPDPLGRVKTGGTKAGGAKPESLFVGPLLDPVRVEALRAIEQTDTVRIERLRETLTDLLTLSNNDKSPAVALAIQELIDKINALDPASKALAERSARIKAALAATPSGKKQDARARVDELQAELNKTQDPVRLNQINEALDAIYLSIDALPTVAEPVFAELDEFTKNFAASVQSTFGDTIFSALTGNFDNIGKAWASMLLRMASDALAADLTKALFPGVKSAGGSALGGLFSAITGGIGGLFGGLFGGGRATGGGVRPFGMYDVVEQGPELLQMGNRTVLLMGKQGGQIIPAGAGGGQGGAAPINVTVNNVFNSGVPRNEMAAYSAAIQAKVMAGVAEAQRRKYSGAVA